MKEVVDKARLLLRETYRRNLIGTIDFLEYAKRIDGFYSLTIIEKLEKLLYGGIK